MVADTRLSAAGVLVTRLMEVVRHGPVDLTPLLTRTFALKDIKEACEVFGKRAGGVIEIAIKP